MWFTAQRRGADYRARSIWVAFFTTAADPLCWTPGESSREMARSTHVHTAFPHPRLQCRFMSQTPIYDQLRGERINADVPIPGVGP
jgi:hypothetical protein